MAAVSAAERAGLMAAASAVERAGKPLYERWKK